MQISKELNKYVKDCVKVSNSNVIITDFEKACLIETLYENNIKNYNLSNTIKNLLQKWRSSNIDYNNLYLLLNGKDCLLLLNNDQTYYTCQMIFPITSSKGIKDYWFYIELVAIIF